MKDVLHFIVEAKEVESVWSLLTGAMAEHGFDRLFYGFTRFRTTSGLGNPRDMMILSNHNDAYVQEFLKEPVFNVAPMVVWAAAHTGEMSWSWVARNKKSLSAAQHDVLALNRSHGVVAGYTISFPDSSVRAAAALALTARAGMSQDEVDAYWLENGRDINLICQIAHLKMSSLPFPQTVDRLSTRQREVLEWVSDGKTMQDIAAIVGLTPATVEKHLRNAREALEVDTTAQAVVKASLQRQIFVVGK